MRIEFLPEAKQELEDAIDFYELQVKGLGAISHHREPNYWIRRVNS